jgi:Xaa-Pro aminopeptidase
MPDRSSAATRILRLRACVRSSDVDAFLILDLKNIRYLCGFSGSDGALLVGPGKPVLLVDGRYMTQAAEEAPAVRVVLYRDKITGIADALSSGGIERVGFEPGIVTVEFLHALRRKARKIKWKALPTELGALRALKDPGEIDRIRRAIRIAEGALTSILGRIRPGMSERDIAVELDYAMRLGGAESSSFDTIVASGPNSALPHARPGRRKIRKGDLLVVDHGASYRGYRSDETCTFAVGRPGKKQERIYAVVKEAHDRALEAVRPGIACRDIDAVARSVIGKAGLGDCFPHGTGHGVGLDVHESPRLSALSESVLEEGMVVTIEPGVYLPGFGGVRIEDMVLVERGGARLLTQFSKELQVIG